MSSFSGEPPGKISNKPPSSFSSLPQELVLEILARVPRRYHPILSCVSQNFRDHFRSPEIQKKRSLLRLDSLYICFNEKSEHCDIIRHWYNLRRINNDPIEDVLDAIQVSSPSILNYSSVIAIDHEIFFVCGTNVPSSNLLIYDTRTRKFRRGPNMLVNRLNNSAGLVGEMIYVIGGHRDNAIVAESFDLKKQIWEVARNPEIKEWTCGVIVSVDRKVYELNIYHGMACYDPRDGSCERLELPEDEWWKCGVCVIQNVLYVYYARFGLMWFDTELKLWRIVDGLSDMKQVLSVGMAEYYGKMAFSWKSYEYVGSDVKDIWCRMIALDKSEVGIQGIAESAQLVRTVPRSYRLQHCLSVSV